MKLVDAYVGKVFDHVSAPKTIGRAVSDDGSKQDWYIRIKDRVLMVSFSK